MRILSYGVDAVYYHLDLPREEVAKIVLQCDRGLAAGLPHVEGHSVNGYRYTLHLDQGLRILVPSEAGLHMGLYVIGGSTFCLSHSPQDYEAVIDSHVFKLGVRVSMAAYKLRRVDPRYDVADGRPDFEREELISRARHRDFYYDGDDFTGMAVGKGDVRFRVYDKVKEAVKGGTIDRWRAIWGDDSSEVWRYEYQLRGDFLKQFGITSMADYLRCEGDVIEYLFEWLRFAYTSVRKDIDRPLLGWWGDFVDQVRGLRLSCIGAIRRLLPRRPNVKGLADQLLGLASSWAAAVAFHRGEKGCGYVEVVNRLIVLVDNSRDRLEEGLGVKLEGYQRAAYA